ncbi:ankyrin repeat domain-containing protein [Maribacter flavus]|uniref:Ankyrin repeat domain-containing protein n=1 Tax=Maribacter flavus TaxID=1658664 RepID=A0A5B2TZE5_9FLAO|nr:ankyrin repeat domain-containing protein [Maribacter flavus]KAA2219774.1 ankyrin repeat domain-containing protein [Maribacter flavus]
MKTSSFKSFKNRVGISALMLVFLTGCGESANKEKVTTAVTNEKSVPKPTMDLQTAILSNNAEVVEQHIASGTDINKKDAMSGSTPLITAVTFDKGNIAAKLIDAGADLTLKNNDGATALHVAAFFGRVEMVQLLIDANADKSLRNSFGATARESVMGPYNEVKPIYEMLQQQLAPMGLQLDLAEIEKTRPVIAMMLQ